MKTVKIPENVTRLEVAINGRTYVYKGGTTVSVPDEVAELLSANAAEAPSGVRATGEVKNAGLVPDGYEEQIPVYTDPVGNLLIPSNTNEARVVQFTQSDGSITATPDRKKIYTMVQKGKAVLGVLSGLVFRCISVSVSAAVFQASVYDASAGTLTLKIITLDKNAGNSLTEKVYDLTEHTEETPDAQT